MFIFFQRILPKHFLSRLLGFFAHCRCAAFKNPAIRYFIRHFNVDLTESLITDIRQFASFNDFFIRQLKPGARPIASDPAAIICPADGKISEIGTIETSRLLQVKGVQYELIDLLGGDQLLAQPFINGQFITTYLAPKDYHRVHMPIAGNLQRMVHIPGQLFSVNPRAVQGIPRLFARNERVICQFETAVGPMAVIFVGAMLIGSVVTPWHGQVMPARGKKASSQPIFDDTAVVLSRGAEVGYFQWGSTVIVLFGSDTMKWDNALQAGDTVRMGQAIGTLMRKTPAVIPAEHIIPSPAGIVE